MQIGIAGLGKMGSAIAARLAETADDARAEIAVWNRTGVRRQNRPSPHGQPTRPGRTIGRDRHDAV